MKRPSAAVFFFAMAPGIPSIANLRVPSKPEARGWVRQWVGWLVGCLVSWWLGLRSFIGTVPPFSMPETFAKYLAQDAQCKRGTFSLT